MYCIHCGKAIDDDSVFCPFCGKAQENGLQDPTLILDIHSDSQTQEGPGIPLPDAAGSAPDIETGKSIPDIPISAADTGTVRPAPDKSAYIIQNEKDTVRAASARESQGTKKEGHGNTKRIWLTAAVILLIVIAGGGAWFYYQSSHKIDESLLVSDLRTYKVLNQVDTYTEIMGSSKNGILAPGQSVKVIQTYSEDGLTTWAQLDDDSWVLASDLQYDYLLPEETIAFESKESNSKYTTTIQTDVFAAPTSMSKPLSDLERGETVFVYETMDTNGGVWGRIGQDQWILLENGDKTFATKEKEETSTTATTDSTTSFSSSAASSSSVVPDSNSTYYPNVTAPESTVIDGYGPGTYTLNYNMHLRRSPRYDGADISVIDKGSKVTVSNVEAASNNSVWGELDYKGSGVWMCLKDNDYIYVH